MKTCPICAFEAGWVFCRRQSEAEGMDFFRATGCQHVGYFFGDRAMRDSERAEAEKRWDVHTEELFEARTAGWTEGQRAGFRGRLWPKVEAEPETVAPASIKTEKTPWYRKDLQEAEF